MPSIVYSPNYNITFGGIELLHPFDSRKYGRAWKVLRDHFGERLLTWSLAPSRAVNDDELLTVHSAAYLERLKQSEYVSRALEIPVVRYLPNWVIDWRVLRPMRWATMGTVVAAREAIRNGFAVNLGGGFHHAKPDSGEGFCVYSDIALAVRSLRQEGLLADASKVVYVDLDAHQGNGVCHQFMHDRTVLIFDQYNSSIYPSHDTEAAARIDCAVPLTSGCKQSQYMGELRDRLPNFLDSISGTEPIAFAIYNAGTDVYRGDPLGALGVGPAGILERDLLVVQELRQRGIPTVMVLSGGYTRLSYQLVADSVIELLEREAV